MEFVVTRAVPEDAAALLELLRISGGETDNLTFGAEGLPFTGVPEENIRAIATLLLREVAERAAAEYGVEFLYRDFRPYFRDGQAFAREQGFYMQKYCGCVFSEEERYLKKNKIIP